MTWSKALLSRRGSIVVEASLIVPIVILSIIAVIYIAILLYQQAYLQSLADGAAIRGAAIWDNKAKSIDIGKLRKEDLDESGLYWRLFDSDKSEKVNVIEGYINSRLDKHSILAGANDPNTKKVDVSLKDYIVYKKLYVTIENAYKIPAGKMLAIFGLKDIYTVRVKSESVITDPTEFIRNTDFILDLEGELEEKYPELKNLGDKTRDIIGGINDKIRSFFNSSE